MGSPRRVVPLMSEQRPEMIPMLSGQGAFGLVTATPSNPIMIVCCGRAPQSMNMGMPFQPCASIREEIPTESPAPASVAGPPGCFIQNEHAPQAYPAAPSVAAPPGCFIKNEHASPATASPMRPPGSWGTDKSSTAGPVSAGASDCSETQYVERC